jgi:hypothetical protein
MSRTNYKVEALIGKALAACCYPAVAWRRFSNRWRVVMLTAYATGAYVAVLSVLFALDHV